MKLPIYCTVASRPVKVLKTEEGGMIVLSYNFDTGEFESYPTLLDSIVMGDSDVDRLTEEEFNQTVEQLRQKLA